MTNREDLQKELAGKGKDFPKVRAQDIRAMLVNQVKVEIARVPGTTTLTGTAVLTMINGVKFTLCTEFMACVDSRNFDEKATTPYLKDKVYRSAENKLFELEGYLLAKGYEPYGE